MSENDIRAAFEQIELPDGAQERMYQNILKKAAAPKKPGNPSGGAMPRWQLVWYWSVQRDSSRCAAGKAHRFRKTPQI